MPCAPKGAQGNSWRSQIMPRSGNSRRRSRQIIKTDGCGVGAGRRGGGPYGGNDAVCHSSVVGGCRCLGSGRFVNRPYGGNPHRRSSHPPWRVSPPHPTLRTTSPPREGRACVGAGLCSARAPAVNEKGRTESSAPTKVFAAICHSFGVGGRRGVGVAGRRGVGPYGGFKAIPSIWPWCALLPFWRDTQVPPYGDYGSVCQSTGVNGRQGVGYGPPGAAAPTVGTMPCAIHPSWAGVVAWAAGDS